MSEDQFSKFLEAVKSDEVLLNKVLSADDFLEASEIANQAGFQITQTDWIRRQAKETLELSDEDIVTLAGGMKRGAKIGIGIGVPLGVAGWGITTVGIAILVK